MPFIDFITEFSILLREDFVQQYIQVSICSLLVYDTMLTMDKEIKYFWTKGWYNLTHILYFINRYVGIFGAMTLFTLHLPTMTTKLCLFSYWAELMSDVIVGVTVDYVLVLRVLALWHKNKQLSIILYLIIICEAAAKFALSSMIALVQQVQATSFSKEISFCSVGDNRVGHALYLQFVDWIITISFGFVLLLLALYKTVEHWRLSGLKGSALVNIMIKDQIIYYLMVLFCSAINIAESRIKVLVPFSFEGSLLNVLGSPSFLCILGSHMFLNLKEAGDLGVVEVVGISDNNNPASTISAPQFALSESSSLST